MSNLIQLHFYLKTPKAYTSGIIPIYCRITINGKRVEFSLNRKCEPSKWCKRSERIRGNREDSKTLNRYIDQFQTKVYEAQELLIRDSEEITADAIRNQVLGKKKSVKTIIQVFSEHNAKVEALVGKEFATGTLERYKTSLKHTQDFIKWKYKVKDLDAKKIDHQLLNRRYHPIQKISLR